MLRPAPCARRPAPGAPSHIWQRCRAAQVRCSGFDADTGRLVTLDVGGAAMVWDPLAGSSMRVLRSFQLRADCREECTCLLLHHNMLVVGARDCMTLYDPRRKAAVASTPLARIGYDRSFTALNNIAARSLALNGCLLSVGLSSGGGVLFFDKRKMGTCVTLPGERSTAARGKFARAMHACTSHAVDTAMPPMLETRLRRDALAAGARRHRSDKSTVLLCVCRVRFAELEDLILATRGDLSSHPHSWHTQARPLCRRASGASGRRRHARRRRALLAAQAQRHARARALRRRRQDPRPRAAAGGVRRGHHHA